MLNRPARLLVVEDNEGDALLIREAIKCTKTPCHVTVAKDGLEAIEHLRHGDNANGHPDLILLDLNLPRKDGREVLREVKQDEHLKHIPILVFTSSRSPEDILTAYKLHANCYLSKPARADEFFGLLSSIDEFWTKLAHLPFAPRNIAG